MKTLISCAYNMDNCCVELKFTDGIVKKEREKIAPEIMRLTDKLMM